MTKKEIGQLIRSEIKRKGSIREFSRRISISRTIIYAILKGENYEIDSLAKVLKELNLKIEIILTPIKK